MNYRRQLRAIAAALFLGAMATLAPVGAQDAPPVLILPINQAQFLPGGLFDFRIEVHTQELPPDLSVTVNGQAADEFFGVAGTEESWEFGGNVVRFNNEGVAPADLTVDALAGDFYNPQFGQITLTAEGDTLTASDGTTLEATDNPLVFNAVGGAADGMTVTFGYNADGELTGFDIAGAAQFGVLAGDLPTPSQSLIWRGVSLPAAGEYMVEVVAGGTTETVTWNVREPGTGGARNVILFIADGMTVPLLTAARIASVGITQGTHNGSLTVDTMEEIGLAHSNSVDSMMSDSANTASALNTGHIGSINATGSYSDTSPSRLDDPRVETFAEMITRLRGMSVGVVATSDFTDATPAAVWAHGRDRSTANRADYARQALEGVDIEGATAQLADLDVLLGGGGQYLLPESTEGSRRSDDRDLFSEYEAAGYTVVTTATELEAAGTPERLMGIFRPGDLNVWLDRNVYTDNLGDFTDQPGLADMTLAALDVLNQNPNGFYLEVEAASVDKQIHPLDQERALSDLIEFDQAVGAAIEWAAANAPDTLIIVTADHGHGYEVYGTVDVEEFNAATTNEDRRNAISTYAAAGYPNYPDADGDGFPEWADATVVFAGTVNNHPDYTEDFQVSEVPRAPGITNDEGVVVDNPDDDPNGIIMSGNLDMASTTGVHTLQDVPVFASGPGADCLGGVYHQREVFFCMAQAIGLNPAGEGGTMDGGMMEATAEATPGS